MDLQNLLYYIIILHPEVLNTLDTAIIDSAHIHYDTKKPRGTHILSKAFSIVASMRERGSVKHRLDKNL